MANLGISCSPTSGIWEPEETTRPIAENIRRRWCRAARNSRIRFSEVSVGYEREIRDGTAAKGEIRYSVAALNVRRRVVQRCCKGRGVLSHTYPATVLFRHRKSPAFHQGRTPTSCLTIAAIVGMQQPEFSSLLQLKLRQLANLGISCSPTARFRRPRALRAAVRGEMLPSIGTGSSRSTRYCVSSMA